MSLRTMWGITKLCGQILVDPEGAADTLLGGEEYEVDKRRGVKTKTSSGDHPYRTRPERPRDR